MATTNTVIYTVTDDAYDIRFDHKIRRHKLTFMHAHSDTPITACFDHQLNGFYPENGRYQPEYIKRDLIRAIEREFSKPLREALGGA